jgi:poly(A) polymerase
VVVPANGITTSDIDQDALRVLSRLHRHGFEAYLVGGCVRDLLLGRAPKDFDVATAAHPRQIKRLFRNGRIIGRRFRLVHVVYGDGIVETSTFRRQPPEMNGDEDDLLITEDNVFGSAAEDARRRDFTINGLFLDPSTWQVHDWVGGLADLEGRVLRAIGEPAVRFAEDPVRILRAIRFATRLGFRIGDRTWDAMCHLTGELVRSAPPRVFEELLRLLRSGTALGAFRMMRASGALRVLLPAVDEYLGKRDDPDPAAHHRADTFWRLLGALDADRHGGGEFGPALLLAVLYLRLIERELETRGLGSTLEEAEPRAVIEVTGDVLATLTVPARVSRRAVERAKRIVAHQRRFTQSSGKSRSTLAFLESQDFADSLHLYRLRSAAWGQGWDVYEGWRLRHERHLALSPEARSELRGKAGPRKRRRRRGPRRSRRQPSQPDEGGFAPSPETG